MQKEVPTRYNHQESEEKIYKLWEESGLFNPDNLPKVSGWKLGVEGYNAKTESFCIIMPPPNANGALHMGHALYSIQDIMIRYWRMRGRKTLWLPGMDHAGFETQAVFEKKLEKEGRNRFEIDRGALYKEMLSFTLENKKIVEHQLRKLGASCDWSRNTFTLDPDVVEQVQKTFIQMHKDGLVYREERLVNWCVKHQTALSDLEVKHVIQKDPLYYMKYGPFTLATVRPETKFGDTAVAVHPKDKRYTQWIGKEIEVEGLIGKFTVKVIVDLAVDPKFGTGVVKVTPGHDFNDFEIGIRHNLERKQVIDRFGKLNSLTGPYAGLKVEEARKKVAADLEAKGLLTKVDEDYTHSIAVCYKCGKQLEPLLLPQWWVKTWSLAEPVVQAIKRGEVKYHPDRFRKITLHWLKNIRDWNISRQIVWGIQIPAWFCRNAQSCAPVVSLEKPETCPTCGEAALQQDPDVFDTWFSSGQWPFLTLGFRDKEPESEDMKTFYPTSVMETAGDIIFFWVARMVMLGLYRTGKIPFKHVYLHGLVRDKDKQKMSKSKGNVIDPLGVTALYGTDAVRMALIAGNTPGQDTAISEDKIRGYRNFVTKIWNIARFILTNCEGAVGAQTPQLIAADRKKIKQSEAVKRKVGKYIESFQFHRAIETAYHYLWHEFADTIVEEAKPRLNAEGQKDRAAALHVLSAVFMNCLIMLHPFAPFVTEEIYQCLASSDLSRDGAVRKLLMGEQW